MATETVRSSPDVELDLGYHTVTFETDSDALARQAAERINAAVKAKFMRRYPLASYSLELEIVAILPGSRRVVTKPKVKRQYGVGLERYLLLWASLAAQSEGMEISRAV